MFTRFVFISILAVQLIFFGVWLEKIRKGKYVFDTDRKEVFFVGIGLIVAIIFSLFLIIGV